MKHNLRLQIDFTGAIPLLGHYHTHKYTVYEQKYHNTIILVTDNRVYFLTADNEEEMESWFAHLNRILNVVRSRDAGPAGPVVCTNMYVPMMTPRTRKT